MFTRISQFSFKPDQLDEMVSRLDGIGEKLESIDGMLETSVFWDTEGSGVSVATYRDQAAADAATETIQSIWGGLMDLLTGPPTMTVYPQGWRVGR